MARIVSEKTLELNVTAEILALIRQKPGCGGSYWIGMKQDQENRNGIDELISNAAPGYHLALQFKSPWRSPREPLPYRFKIGNTQLLNLRRLASAKPNSVYYVFPRFNTFDKMRTFAPHLLADTWFLRVADVANLSAAGNAFGTHRVECMPGSVTIFSDPLRFQVVPAEQVVGQSIGRPDTTLLSHAELREWLQTLEGSGAGYYPRFFQDVGLRGFGTICISDRGKQ